MLWCSQVAPGHENGLKVRVYGTKGGLEWVQADPNYLWYTPFGETQAAASPATAPVPAPAAARVSPHPLGSPGRLSRSVSRRSIPRRRKAIIAQRKRRKVDKAVVYPTVDDGVKGVAFVDACVAVVEEERRVGQGLSLNRLRHAPCVEEVGLPMPRNGSSPQGGVDEGVLARAYNFPHSCACHRRSSAPKSLGAGDFLSGITEGGSFTAPTRRG